MDSPNPLNMRESAIGMHEMLVSLMDAGFTRQEAVYLVASMMSATVINTR